MPQQPNIILLTCHDLGDTLSIYGVPVPTPNIERMAAGGVVFQNHFSTGSICSPARGSIHTGCYPHTHGLMGLVHRGWELKVERCPTLAMLLGQAGYQTHLFGFQHEHWDAARLGYGEIHSCGANHVEEVVPRFDQWLRARQDKMPFFAAVGVSEIHRMGMMPSHFKREIYEPADPARVLVPPYLPDIPEIRQDLADLYGAVKLVDKMLGLLLDTLVQTGLDENTLLIFTTDHGISFIHAKSTLYDGGTKVALLMRWPKGFRGGQQIRALTSHADLVPTLLTWLGLPVPAHVQGISQTHLPLGQPGAQRDHIFSEENMTNYYAPMRMARSQTMKYIRNGVRRCVFDFMIPEQELSTWDFSPATRAVFSFYSTRRYAEELYDLRSDPGELHNLIEDATYAGALAELRAALDAHLERTDDPFRLARFEPQMDEWAYVNLANARR